MSKNFKQRSNLFCSSENISDFVSPILNYLISQYYDIKFEIQKDLIAFYKLYLKKVSGYNFYFIKLYFELVTIFETKSYTLLIIF
jgi:hypothetical protein